MTKKDIILRGIADGLDDDQILLDFETRGMTTTRNSIRWYRSKVKSPSPRASGLTMRPRPRVARDTVGEALERFNLKIEVIECLLRLGVSVDETYDWLQKWTFVTNDKVSGRFGQCNYTKRQIEVHAGIIDLPYDLRNTFLHEIAHALDYYIHGRSSGHGPEWQHIMSHGFLLDPRRCGDHTEEAARALEAVAKKKAVEVWYCVECGVERAIMRKRKYPAHQYRHRGCIGTFRVKREG